MVVLWYGLISAFAGTTIGAICCWLWYCQGDGGNEAFYAGVTATAAAILSFFGLIIQYYFDERSQLARRVAKEQEKAGRKQLLDRIERERRNFERIRDKRDYNSEDHRRAVEDSSIELLCEELERMRNDKKYRKLIAQALAETRRIENLPPRQKDVSRLIPILDKIEVRFHKDGVT